MKAPTLLMILDGFGYNESDYGNAIRAAKTPNLDRFLHLYPHTLIGASGMDVGLPDGQMGNSEVGHTNIGAGRIVYQELTRITKSIQDGDFFENPALLEAVENCKKKDSALHLIGLVSDGGVHSHNTHLYALLELAKRHGLEKVYIHCLMDGRDVPPHSGKDYIAELQAKCRE
ncbi:MAG TPA: 2,3-bisphosphoglycerate-independent phosphoglycerate mutase, partial [Clostridiales bacterium]|nr:2,3-bisphosphoglycerate-independent phosphoglycerate mutase [Clostridiales bacterium]